MRKLPANSGKSKRVSPVAGQPWNSSKRSLRISKRNSTSPSSGSPSSASRRRPAFRRAWRASPLLRDRLKIIEQAAFLEIVPDGATPLLVSGDLRPFFRLLPPNRKYFIRSLAVSPLTLHGRLIGSLNHGDSSSERYEPGMDTTLLMHLAQSVSDRLSHLLPIEQPSRYRHEP